jgi:hypothetical protein
VTVLAKEEIEAHHHALQTMTEQFQLYELEHFRFGELHLRSEMFGLWYARDYTQLIHVILLQ